MTRTWHCEIEGGVILVTLPLEYSACQAAATAWGDYGEYTLHGEYSNGIVTVWADDQPRRTFYVTVREEKRCYASEIEENAEPK